MKILYVTQYFYPEVGATTNRALANVKYLSKKGHDVTVLTEIPNHPIGKIFKGYKYKIFMKEKMKNFKINRVWVFTSTTKNFITRLLFYISFMFMGSIHTLFNWKQYDVVYITSPPLFVAEIGIILRLFHSKTKLIFEVRDLWPDSAIELGELKNKAFIKSSLKLEKKIYDISEHIIVISENMKNKIIAKGYPDNKISIIHNGVDDEFITRKLNADKKIFYNKNSNKFICVYAGIIGIAQGLEIILEAANRLRDADIEFYLIGYGPKLEQLKVMSAKMKLENLTFLGQISRDEIQNYLASADLGIIPLKKKDLFKGALPSKIFDFMACKLPIVLGIEGEAKELIENSETGIAYEPENVDELVKTILILKENEQMRNTLSKNGRKIVKEKFNRMKLAEKLEKIIVNIGNNK